MSGITATSSSQALARLNGAQVPERVRQLLLAAHGIAAQVLASPLQLTMVQLERELFGLAEKARNSQVQADIYAQIRQLGVYAAEFPGWFLDALADDLARLRGLCDALFQEPFLINGRRIPITAAFGMSTAPLQGLAAERLLREADAAMYEAKRNRSTAVVAFDSAIHERAARQFQIEASLPEAIARGEIEVYYQPIHDVRRDCIAGFEALARWRHPDLGWIPPPEFVQAAVETGHVGALTQRILRSACEAFLPHLDAPCEPYLAVNVSVSDIYASDFPAQLAQTLSEAGMPPRRLVLEVTEDMLLGDQQHVAAALEQLHRQGVRIAIDDFGTGYSSMGYLSHYQVNLIKIDQSFVRRILDSAPDRKIVRAIVSMAGDLELGVVVEGVETAEQIELLRGLGCELLQGYAFSRPRPAAEWAAGAQAGCGMLP